MIDKRLCTPILLILSLLLVSSCSVTSYVSNSSVRTFNKLEVHSHNGYNYYLAPNEGSSKLIIYLEGSSMNSVLGVKSGRRWTSIQTSYFVLENYSKGYNMVIPEKLTMSMGGDYSRSIEMFSAYTLSNMVDAYVTSIDHHLQGANYDSVYLVGASEGGLLAPKVYNALRSKAQITKMVIIGSGGLAQDECFEILGDSHIQMPSQYKLMCQQIDSIRTDVEQHPDALNKFYLGWPYKRWSSFFGYRPIDEFRHMEIPILFVQGTMDWSSPVESVQYVEENLESDNLTFIYKEMGHLPEDDEEYRKLFNEIESWLNSK